MLKLGRSATLACQHSQPARPCIAIAPTIRNLWTQSRLSTTKFVPPSTSLRHRAKSSTAIDPTQQAHQQATFDDAKVHIVWDPTTQSRFHHFWLRDHCRCSDCFQPVTKQRLLNTFEVPESIKPTNVESTPDGLRVTWPSVTQPHVSEYPWHWLKHNSYDPVLPRSTDALQNNKTLWSSKTMNDPPTVPYDAVMSGDKGLWKWLQNIDTFGFSFVTGVPVSPEATEELCTRIAHIRHTHYGGFWEFTSDLSKGDTAYDTIALGAHTDNTYFTDPAGLQLFHLLSHTEGSGGESLLVDGFHVASILKDLHPEMYDVLSKVRIPQHAAGEENVLYKPTPCPYPILNLSPTTNELYQVRYNNDDRSAVNSVDPQTLEAWYAALRQWNLLLTSPDSEYWFQLKPGTVVGIDNHRVLHGRSEFTGKRRMCGAYIGFDDYRSKLAVLNERLNKTQPVPGQETNVRSVWSHSF